MIGDKYVTLAYGNGGRFMRTLIEDIFARRLSKPLLDIKTDAAYLPMSTGKVLLTDDGFTVHPLEFPGDVACASRRRSRRDHRRLE